MVVGQVVSLVVQLMLHRENLRTLIAIQRALERDQDQRDAGG